MATDWAAEAAKYGGAVASQPQAQGSTNWAAEAAKYGGTVSSSPAPAQSKPGFVSDTLSKTAHNMNVVNTLKQISDAGDGLETLLSKIPGNPLGATDHGSPDVKAPNMTHEIALTAALGPGAAFLAPIVKDTIAKIKGKDVSGALANLIPLAFMADGAAGDPVGEYGSRVVDNTSNVASKYGSRVVENSPAAAKAIVQVVKDAAGVSKGNIGTAAVSGGLALAGHPELASTALLIKAAANVAKGGNLAAAAKAVSKILTKPSYQEVLDSNAARTPVWDGMPDADPATSTPTPTTPANTVLPSGRTVGGYQNQTVAPSPSPLGPANLTMQQRAVIDGMANKPTITPEAPQTLASVQPIESSVLPSGRIPGKASTQITSKVEISPKISTKAASDSMGTTPATANGNGDIGLNMDTQTRLAKAASENNGAELKRLPAGDKAALKEAIVNGDDQGVHSILDKNDSVIKHKQDVANKIAVLVRYAQDHNIDLDAIEPQDRQAIADLAVQHAKAIDGLVGPRSGKYRGISDSSWDAIKAELRKQ